MSSSCYLSSELKNIPIAVSILHEQEYKNLCSLFKKDTTGKRRACSEKNTQKNTICTNVSLTCKV